MIDDAISECASGRELSELGYGDDVRIAAALDVSPLVPRLVGGVLLSDSAR